MVKVIVTFVLILSLCTLRAQNFRVQQLFESIDYAMYSPAFFGEKLVVSSHKKDRIVKTVLDEKDMEPSDLYIIDPEQNLFITRFDNTFRTAFNDGPISFNDDQTYCVISQSNNTSKKLTSFNKSPNLLGLFESTKDQNNEWSSPVPLSFNNEKYINTHPAIYTKNGELTVVFSSNRPNGFGGFDLWWSTKKNGRWSKPKNFGEEINSRKNEVFPSVINQELFFSSESESGDLDLYRIKINRKGSVKRVLPEPMNSKFDDFGITSMDHMQTGYFSSNRNGQDAIFRFDYDFPDFIDCQPQVSNAFCYTLEEEYATEIGNISALIYQWDIDGIKLEGMRIDYCFPEEGSYQISLNIVDTVINQVYANQASYEISLKYTIEPYISCYDSVRIGESFHLRSSESYLPEVSEKRFFWIIDDTEHIENEEIDYVFNTKGKHEIILGVKGIKDGKAYSQCVSKQIIVVDIENSNLDDFIDLHSLDNTIISEETYSSEKKDSLITVYSVEVLNSSTKIDLNSTSLSNLSKAYDLRTEYNQDRSKYLLLIGKYDQIENVYTTWTEIKNKGYIDAIIQTFLIDNYENIILNENFEMKNLYFDLGGYKLNSESRKEILKIVAIMKKFPSLILEVGAHTDNQGDFDYNLKLTVSRAKAIKEEMINKGISANRVITNGFGDTKPINTNDTEEGRKKNRRVQFKLHTP